MVAVQRRGKSLDDTQVSISNTAVNMISSLHPTDKSKVARTVKTVTSSVRDEKKVARIIGVENAYVARAGNLRVVFKKSGDKVVIESVVKQG